MLIISCSLLFLFLTKPIVAQEHTPRAETQPRDATITKVRLVGSPLAYYGILLLEVNGHQTGICDDRFDRNVAKVACRELNFVDGRFQPGSVLGGFTVSLKTLNINCQGTETRLSQCQSQVESHCLSQEYVTLYCSASTITEKDNIDVRIRGGDKYGLVEANRYGFWGPICDTGWSDKEANTVCKQLNKQGGVAYYATTVDDSPMVIGGFNCSRDETSLGECDFKGFDELLGCQYRRPKGSKQRAAGVLCYEHEDGVQFRLSNKWYGKVQVEYDGEWGLVCDTNWGDKEAHTLCKQLGFKGGHAKKEYIEDTGYNRMDDVDCTGNESSILECSHTAGWTPTRRSCTSASVKCDTTVCGSFDIRNNVMHLEKLRHCNVIEGFLTILLIDATWEEYKQYSFPNLVEITDHLVLFRVGGLRSLRYLFPKLAIIRGDELFLDYALVAYEMLDLTELGLANLVSIPRGAVRIEKNPNLCYIETVDWKRITNIENTATNTFLLNKDVQECANKCPKSCHETKDEDGLKPRCWTINDCQKMLACPASCKSGFCNGDVCCDRNCIAGCTGPSPKECTACRDVITHDKNGDPTCTQKCIHGTYEYRFRRCLLDKECVNFSDYDIEKECYVTNSSIPRTACLKLLSKPNPEPGMCVKKCPSGYNVDPYDIQKCIPCKGKCPKICESKIIDSVTAAQDVADCNIIKGALEIKLMQGGQIGQELEKNLAQIEEVTGYIRVHSSYALLTLHFLSGLRKIGGETLFNGYVFYVFNNMNLMELFEKEVASNLTIGNGSLFFQSNKKLCYKKITDFVSAIGRDIKNISNEDISRDTNGDYMPCEIQTLKVYILKVTSHIALLNWTLLNMTDDRQLIGYSINWKETKMKNVSIYQGRDACSDDLWKSKDACQGVNCNRSFNFIVGLLPWTEYAVYVRALTISKAEHGAISDVYYFRTQAEVPTSPLNLRVRAERAGELRVTWDPPNSPNGNVTHYQVYWQQQEFDPADYELRDYCLSPITSNKIRRYYDQEDEEKNSTSTADNCCCPKSEKEQRAEERERNLAIQFQDYLQNQVYIKRIDYAVTKKPNVSAASRINTNSGAVNATHNGTRTKRDVPSSDSHEKNKYTYQPQAGGSPTLVLSEENGVQTTSPTPSTTSSTVNAPRHQTRENPSFVYADVFVKREFIISNLGHFEDYNIEVIACHNRPTDNTKENRATDPIRGMLCSNQALGFGRTLPDTESDRINSSTVTWELTHNKTNSVHIKWRDPQTPNGLILTYEIEYRNPNIQYAKPISVCVTFKDYKENGMNGHILEKLEPGNYLFRVRVTSLAGNGSWTEEMSFVVPEQDIPAMEKDTMIIVIISCLVAIMIITVIVVWFVAKKRFHTLLRDTMFTSANPDYYPDWGVYEPDEWEVDRDNVVLIKELGQGSFGMVYEGYVKNLIPDQEKVPVAVKTTNANSDDHDRYQFLQELSIMKQFKCHHVVRLIGVVSKDQPAYVLMELMPQGDLKNFLRLHRPDDEDNDGRQPPSLKQILQMAGEIADGMAYLADKKFVHRDLAARNCMVGDDMTVKIGDFGMTRDIYETDYYRKGSRGLLPVRWMAPESLKDGVFTSMTDVWSYGVVLWEMATLAAQPYQGLSNEEVLRYVGSGKIMDTPERCPTKLYDLMVKCWRYRPKQRPTFKEIIEALLPDLDRTFQDVSYFFSEENAKYEESKQQAGTSNNHHDDNLELIDDDEDGDPHCPMNDYVDEAQLPMLGVGASNGHSVELQDIFSDTGTYPYNSSQNKQPASSCEVCDCNYREDNACRELAEGAAAQSMVNFNRQCESPNSAIGGSSDGSKDSSKSSSSSYARMNGLSVANGHVPVHMRTTPC